MTKNTIKIKPLSVNEAWKGRRFKTPKYKTYERTLSLILPNKIYIPHGDIWAIYEFGTLKLFDIDNAIKPLQDILQIKYGFNDNRIMQLSALKKVVKKGGEYLAFELRDFKNE